MHYISDIATDPTIKWVQETGAKGALITRKGHPVRFSAIGTREGTNILTVIEPGGEGIITGYPIP